jgi:glycosyltransferase involved in cell wall biosynthesis
MPHFTVIMPCRNAAETVKDALASLYAQSLQDWELIAIDDGSSDATRHILDEASHSDPSVRVVSGPAKGPAVARNLGAEFAAPGSILVFLDADDIWADDKLETLATVFNDPSVDAAFGRIRFFEGAPEAGRVESTVPKGALTVSHLLGENPVCTMSNVAIRVAAFMRTGGFETSMVHNEDLEWLIRLVATGARMIGVDTLQVFYRTSQGGLSSELTAMAAGRARALETARRFGHRALPRHEAMHLRYLARRALRLDAGPGVALRLALQGVFTSPSGFMFPKKRGVMTLVGALLAPILPRPVRHALFTA